MRIASFELASSRLVVASRPKAQGAQLSPAEREIAQLITQGMSNAEIARARGRSVRTIANQVRAVLGKLGTTSRRGVTRALLRGP